MPLETAVKNALRALLDNGQVSYKPKPSYLVVHFSWGLPGSSGYIMKSAAFAENCRFATWANNVTYSPLHADVLVRHARQFHRVITVPALLVNLSDLEQNKTVIMMLQIGTGGEALDVKRSLTDGRVYYHIGISELLASTLCPSSLLSEYLHKLYPNDIDERRLTSLEEGEALRLFELPRYNAFAILKPRFSDLEDQMNNWFGNGTWIAKEEPLRLLKEPLRLLSTLQSALLWFEGSRLVSDKDESSAFVPLGTPWDLDPNRFQDAIPLVCHDGATVIWPADNHTKVTMEFRQLLVRDFGRDAARVAVNLGTSVEMTLVFHFSVRERAAGMPHFAPYMRMYFLLS